MRRLKVIIFISLNLVINGNMLIAPLREIVEWGFKTNVEGLAKENISVATETMINNGDDLPKKYRYG